MIGIILTKPAPCLVFTLYIFNGMLYYGIWDSGKFPLFIKQGVLALIIGILQLHNILYIVVDQSVHSFN